LKVDLDKLEKVCEKVVVEMLPSFFVYVDGQKIDEARGAIKEEFLELVTKYASQNL